MTQATSIAARWYNTPRTVAPEYHGDRPYWTVDGVTVTVGEGDKLEITSNSRSATPQMRIDVYDGEMRLPLEDLVPTVLERLPIEDLARMLCADKDARRVVLDALAAQYVELPMEDEDRRYWLARVGSGVHSKQLDALAYSMTRIEHAVAQTGYRAMDSIAWGNVLAHHMAGMLQFLGASYQQAWAIAREFEAYHFDRFKSPFLDIKAHLTDLGHYGALNAWSEARDHWRGQIEALFPNIEVPAEPQPETADIFA